MSRIRSRVGTVILCVLALCTSMASADMGFKRIKCKDAVTPNSQGIMLFHNTAGFTKYVAVRVSRDGCRPKGDDGSFSVNHTDFYETTAGSANSVTRMG